MNATMVRTVAMKLIETEKSIRRLCLGVLAAWGLLATALLASNASGGWTLWVVGTFAIFGTGLGLAIVGFWSTETAYRLTIIVGGGLAGVTLISQLLMLTGTFDPMSVVGVETGVIALLWFSWEGAIWRSRS